MNLAEWEVRYLAHHRALGHSEKTVYHYEASFKVWHLFLAERDISGQAALTTGSLNAFAIWLKETPTRGFRGSHVRTAAGIHGVMKDLRAFVRWLVEEEIIEKAPKVPVPKVPQQLFKVLTQEELERIFSCRQLDTRSEIGHRNRALVAFMLDTGVRLSEVANLSMERLRLRDGAALIEGKGSKERMVYFSDGTQEAIRRWLVVRGEAPGTVFWLKPAGVRQVLERVKKETGLSVLFAHQIRHTAFTMLVRDGVDLHTIKRLAGHASVTTSEAYLALADDDLRQKQRQASPFDRINERLTPVATGRRRLKTA